MTKTLEKLKNFWPRKVFVIARPTFKVFWQIYFRRPKQSNNDLEQLDINTHRLLMEDHSPCPGLGSLIFIALINLAPKTLPAVLP